MSDTTQRTPMVTGLFKDRASAERAYQSLESRGYSRDDVNLMMSDQTRDTHFGEGTPDTELGSKALEGAGAGSAIGGTLGAHYRRHRGYRNQCSASRYRIGRLGTDCGGSGGRGRGRFDRRLGRRFNRFGYSRRTRCHV